MGYWNRPAIELAVNHPPEAANSVSGYIRISRDNEVLYLHRWLWEELVGPIPAGHEIDHKDKKKTNCEMDNLRCIPQVINLRNQPKRADNTSGVTGVSLWRGKYWRATTWDHITGKQIMKAFSINKWGYQLAFDMACDTRADMIEDLNQRGAGYAPTHGQ